VLDATRDEGLAAPAGSALVRILATDGSWIRRVPPVPAAHVVTVSIGMAAHAEVSDADLAASGCRIVGPQPASVLPDAVELLVPGALMAEQVVMGSHLGVHLGR
jgi:hypothetical protein